MNAYKLKSLKIILILTIVSFAFTVSAQVDINEVIEAFNAGAGELNSGNFEVAIIKFEECIDLATQLGTEGDEMKAKAEEQIPQLFYRIASDLYKQKDIDGAITKFEETVEACDKYGNEDIKAKAEKYIPTLYYSKGNSHIKNEEYDEALASFDRAIEYKPDYARAYYGKGLVYKKLEDDEKMIEALDKAIEAGNAANDQKTIITARKAARDHYVLKGMLAMKEEDYESAITNFNTSFNYVPENSDPHYYLSVIYNKQLEYDKAAEHANKAIEFSQEDENGNARIYYELGNAYMGLVEYGKACEAFSHALVEPYEKTVRHKMENVLNCQ